MCRQTSRTVFLDAFAIPTELVDYDRGNNEFDQFLANHLFDDADDRMLLWVFCDIEPDTRINKQLEHLISLQVS